jgi:hypothetical protein
MVMLWEDWECVHLNLVRLLFLWYQNFSSFRTSSNLAIAECDYHDAFDTLFYVVRKAKEPEDSSILTICPLQLALVVVCVVLG